MPREALPRLVGLAQHRGVPRPIAERLARQERLKDVVLCRSEQRRAGREDPHQIGSTADPQCRGERGLIDVVRLDAHREVRHRIERAEARADPGGRAAAPRREPRWRLARQEAPPPHLVGERVHAHAAHDGQAIHVIGEHAEVRPHLDAADGADLVRGRTHERVVVGADAVLFGGDARRIARIEGEEHVPATAEVREHVVAMRNRGAARRDQTSDAAHPAERAERPACHQKIPHELSSVRHGCLLSRCRSRGDR
jgi:hypothetical protein